MFLTRYVCRYSIFAAVMSKNGVSVTLFCNKRIINSEKLRCRHRYLVLSKFECGTTKSPTQTFVSSNIFSSTVLNISFIFMLLHFQINILYICIYTRAIDILQLLPQFQLGFSNENSRLIKKKLNLQNKMVCEYSWILPMF